MSVFKTTATATRPVTGAGRECETMEGYSMRETAGATARARIFSGAILAPGACAGADDAAAGLVTVGNHLLKVTYVTEDGETDLGTASAAVAAAGAKKLAVSSIPVYSGPGAMRVTGRKVYMTEAGGATYYLVATLTDNTTTTALVNVSDATLVGLPAAPTENLSGVLCADRNLAANECVHELFPRGIAGGLLLVELVSGAVQTLIYGT